MISLKGRPLYRLINDRSIAVASTLAIGVASVVVVLIMLFLGKESLPAISEIGLGRLFSDSSWNPESQGDEGLFYIVPMLAGTLAVSTLALAIALPLGLLTAVYTEFYAPRGFRFIMERAVELLAGIPSVVLGMWGLLILVPKIQQIDGHGASVLAGALVLGIMIIPTIALSSRSAIQSVAEKHRMQTTALGLGRSCSVLDVFIPLSRKSIGVGIILAGARAIGETMVVVMVCGNMSVFPQSVFDPVRTLTATIALEMGYSYGAHRGSLFLIGLLLMLSVLTALLLSKLIPGSSLRGEDTI